MSLFSAHCIPVERMTWQNREFASTFASNLRNQQLRLIKCLKDPFRATPWEWYWCSKTSQTSVMDFGPWDHPSSSRTDENLEKVRQSICENTRPMINESEYFRPVIQYTPKQWNRRFEHKANVATFVLSEQNDDQKKKTYTSCVQRTVKARQKGQRFAF